MSVADALRDATVSLSTISDTPRLDAELLMAHALGIGRNDLLLRQRDLSVPVTFAVHLQQRLAGAPIAHILGSRDFWTISLAVTPDVLIPRPDSETLIEAAVDHFAGRAPQRILDLGTGPGTLLLAALDEWPQATGLGVDASEVALDYALRNGAALGMAQRVAWRQGDWTAGIDGRFDLILANPPYIGTDEPLPREVVGHEPAAALFAGRDGLDDYRRIVPELRRLLAPDGIAAIEIGYEQGDAVMALVRAAGLPARLVRDLGDRPRCVITG